MNTELTTNTVITRWVLKLVYSMNTLLRSNEAGVAELVGESSFDQGTFIEASFSRGFIKEPATQVLIMEDPSIRLPSEAHSVDIMQQLAAHAYAHGFMQVIARNVHPTMVTFLLSQGFAPRGTSEFGRDSVLPCPFCGTPPTKVAAQDGSRGFSCTYDHCPTDKSLFIGGHSHIFDSAYAWNTRHTEVDLPFYAAQVAKAGIESEPSATVEDHMNQPPTTPTNGSSNSQSGILPIRNSG